MLSQPKVQSASDLDISIKDSQESPTDTVSSISWAPSGTNPTFATSDWASYIRIYNLDPETSSLTLQACFDAQSPCLSVKWHEDERTVFAGCTDGSVKSYNVTSGNSSLIGNHEGPVKSVHWIPESNLLLSVSFDKTVRFWDPRQVEPTAVFQLDYKVLCSDVLFPYLTIGMSEAKCLIVDLTKAQEQLGGREVKYLDSPLGADKQMTSVKIFKDENERIGFGISGNQGKCNLSYFGQREQLLDKFDTIMTFLAHKIDPNHNKRQLYPVNCLGFHPHRGSQFLYTGGGEGKMYFWDVKKKNKIADFEFKGLAVNQAEIDPTGKYMAYALGYDWARGIQSHMTRPSKICVHILQERELENNTQLGTSIKYPQVVKIF